MLDSAFLPANPPTEHTDDELSTAQPLTRRGASLHRFLASPSGIGGSVLLLLLVAAGLAAPWLAPVLRGHTSTLFTYVPQQDLWVATRSALAASMPAMLPSLIIGVLAGLIAALLGLTIGGLAGYLGGWIDALLALLMAFASALPFLPFAIAVIAATGAVQGVLGLVLIFAALGWVGIARLVRAQLLVLREQPFIEAAQSVGINHPRILVRHLFPHLYPSVIIATVLSMASFMLAEATLDFLRIGVAHTVTLGSLLADYDAETAFIGGQNLPQVIVPGVILWLLVLALQLIGQGLQEALDVQAGR